MARWMRCLNLDGRVPISESVKWLKLPPHPDPCLSLFLFQQPPYHGKGWDQEDQGGTLGLFIQQFALSELTYG